MGYNPSFLVVMENHHFQSEGHHTIANCKQITGGQHPLLPFSLLKSNEVTPTVEKPTPQASENVMAGNFFNNPPGLCQFTQIYESSGAYHGFTPHQKNHGLSTSPKRRRETATNLPISWPEAWPEEKPVIFLNRHEMENERMMYIDHNMIINYMFQIVIL